MKINNKSMSQSNCNIGYEVREFTISSLFPIAHQTSNWLPLGARIANCQPKGPAT